MKTTVVHCKKSPYDVYIGRPSKWGNPYTIGRDGTRDEVIAKFSKDFYNNPKLQLDAKSELSGKILGCWCKPKDCHGEVIAEFLNGEFLEE